jgi:hypothetical protein
MTKRGDRGGLLPLSSFAMETVDPQLKKSLDSLGNAIATRKTAEIGCSGSTERKVALRTAFRNLHYSERP